MQNIETSPSCEDKTGNREVHVIRPWRGAAVAAALAAAVTFGAAIQTGRPPVAPTFDPQPGDAPQVVSDRLLRAAFFDEVVQPQIVQTDALNRQAADRCVDRLGGLVDEYRDGVDPFVDDLTSWKTRLGIARRMPGNWWKGDGRIDAYVQEKFETHLFSQEALMRDVAAILEDFRSEVDANQKRMLVSVRASLETSDLPELQIDQYEPFFHAVTTQLRGYTAGQGTTSVYHGVTILIASEVGSYAAYSVAAGLLARFGTAAAATAAVGVGATAGAGAAGAGTGTLVGPAGTVVGLGVGLAVGLIIDWWMTEKMEQRLVTEMKGYLDTLQATLMHGTQSGAPALGAGGMADALPMVCDRLMLAYRDRFFHQLVNSEPSP